MSEFSNAIKDAFTAQESGEPTAANPEGDFKAQIKQAAAEQFKEESATDEPTAQDTEGAELESTDEADASEEVVAQEETAEGEPQDEPTERERRIVKAIVDGQEIEASEEEAIAALQKVKAANKRFQEAAELKKQAEAEKQQVLERLKTDPAGVLKELGLNVDELAENYLIEKWEEEALPEEERKLRQAARERDQLKRQLEEQKRQEEEAALQQEKAKIATEWAEKINAALVSSKVPKNPYMATRIANLLRAAHTHGQGMSAEEATKRVWDGYTRETQEVAKNKDVTGEDLLKLLGKEGTEKVRKALLSKVKNPAKSGKGVYTQNKKSPTKKSILDKEDLTFDDLRRMARGF